jgi:hypothetical protein
VTRMVDSNPSSSRNRNRSKSALDRLAACCSIACVAMVVLFLLSVRLRIKIGPIGQYSASLGGGRLYVEDNWHDAPRTPSKMIHKNIDGVQWLPDHHKYPKGWFIRLPLWTPFLAFATPLLARWCHRRWSEPPGCCRRCRYDLRGQAVAGRVVSIRCPECGHSQRIAATGRP